MRLDTAREDTITNLGGSHKFRMNPSAKAFQILSSGIYERKIEAIVRELSCNAYDSHVMAGKEDEPFRVQLPTAVNDFVFAIEDFGVGLSEEEVYNVYTTYFESTKTDSNDVIGALGLGSKTPFSYTDSFTVKARKDGKECVFSAQISSSGEPEVVKMYERPWSGSNGVEVSVEVASKDTYEFYECAAKVYSWFEVKPISNKVIEYDISSEVLSNVKSYGFHLHTKDRWSNTDCRVIMGNVAYYLDLEDLITGNGSELEAFILELKSSRADFYFTIPIGDADVAASRETLSLDDRTKANLCKRIDEIRVGFNQATVDKVSKMSSVFEVAKLTPYERRIAKDISVNGYCFKNVGNYLHASVRVLDYQNPTPLEAQLLQTSSSYDISFLTLDTKNYKHVPRSMRTSSCDLRSLLINNKVTVVINDCERKLGVKGAVTEENSLPSSVLIIQDKETKLTPELEQLISHITFGCYKIVYTSSFWDGKLNKNKSVSKGLASSVVKGRFIRRGRRYFCSAKIDFSNENISRWAYVKSDTGFASGSWVYLVDGNGTIVHNINDTNLMAGTVHDLMEELDLDGVIAYNTQNEKKVKRIFSEDRSLLKLVEDAASLESATLQVQKEVISSCIKTPLRVFEGYETMVESLKGKEPVNPISSEIVWGRSVKMDKIGTLTSTIENRTKVFQKELDLLRKNSVVLRHLLGNHFVVKMIPEIREIIKMKKGK